MRSMARPTPVFLLFLLVAGVFGLALPLLLPQLVQGFADNLAVAFGASVALCSSLLAQIPVLSFLSTGCLVACIFLLSLAAGSLRYAQQIRGTRSFVSQALAQRISEIPGEVAELVEGMGLTGRVDVVGTHESLAFCYGLQRPRICISLGLIRHLPLRELEAVLLHERRHLEQRDPLRILVARTIAATFFYLPVLTLIEKHFLVCTEVEADRAVVERMGSRRYLAGALHSLLTAPTIGASPVSLSVGSFDATEERVDYLLGLRPVPRPQLWSRQSLISLASLGGLSAALAWMLNSSTVQDAMCPVSDSITLTMLAFSASTPSLWAALLSTTGCLAIIFLAPRRFLRS